MWFLQESELLANENAIRAGNPVIITMKDENWTTKKIRAIVSYKKIKDAKPAKILYSQGKIGGEVYIKVMEVLNEDELTIKKIDEYIARDPYRRL